MFDAKLRFVKLHMTSQVQTTQVLVKKSLEMSGLLEEYVITNLLFPAATDINTPGHIVGHRIRRESIDPGVYVI